MPKKVLKQIDKVTKQQQHALSLKQVVLWAELVSSGGTSELVGITDQQQADTLKHIF